MRINVRAHIDPSQHVCDIWAWNTSLSVYADYADEEKWYTTMGMFDSGGSLGAYSYRTITEILDDVAEANSDSPCCAEEETVEICVDKNYQYKHDILAAVNGWVEQWNLIQKLKEDEEDEED